MQTICIPVEAVRDKRLRPAHLRVYVYLVAEARGLRASEIAKAVDLSEVSTRAAVTALEAEGLAYFQVIEHPINRQPVKLWFSHELDAQ